MEGSKRCPDCGETKLLTEFYKSKGRPDGHASICKVCSSKRKAQARKNMTDEQRAAYDARCAERQERVGNERRQTMRDWKEETGCSICGYNKNSGSLDFHHVEPKNPKVSSMLGNGNIKVQKINEELGKCVLLCKNCHFEVHSGVTELPADAPRVFIPKLK